MDTRPLRTKGKADPRTQGERIRVARTAAGLSQGRLADAITMHGGRATKSLVSQWERDTIANPENANLFAIQAITGYRAEWISTGKEPKKLEMRSPKDSSGLDRKLLARAIAATLRALPSGEKDPQRIADIVSRLYDTLITAPDVDPATLDIVAAALAKP